MQRVKEKDGGDGIKMPLDALANANGLNQRGRHPSMDSFLADHKLFLNGDPQGKRANLIEANLRNADLRGADLSGANLAGADLCDADLSEANLAGADLAGANLSGANLAGADLSEAYLLRADLRGANLCDADLSGADLSRADLSRADLSGADLRGADPRGADLRGADLSGTGLVIYQFDEWSAYITRDIITIGCQSHALEKWLSFSDRELSQVHSDAGESVKRYRAVIAAIHAALPR